MSPLFLLSLGTVVAIIGAVGLLVLRRLTGATGFRIIPKQTAVIVASDTGAGIPATVRDPRLGLRGRPDYLVEERNGHRHVVPVEIKPNRRSKRLYKSERIQLGAYLVALAGSLPDRAASYGYVWYASAAFRVALSHDLTSRVEAVASAIRTGRNSPIVHRSHSNPALCARCALRHACNEALG